AEGFEHCHMRPQPGVLLHIQGRFDERVSTEWQAADEQVHRSRPTGGRIMRLHRRSGPVDLDRLCRLVPDPGRGPGDEDMALICAAETVVAHRRRPRSCTVVGVLAVQQLQRHSHTSQLFVDLFPVRLSKYAVMLTTTWENQLIDLVVCAVLDVVPTQLGRIGGLKYRGHRLPRHPLRCRYCSGRQPVCPKLQHQLGSDLSYHEWSPSVACRIHATEGA